MLREEFAEKVAARAGTTKKAAVAVITALFGTHVADGVITEEVAAGNKLMFPGFGAFSYAERKPRPGRNPQTGEGGFMIPARNVPKFKAGKRLKDAMPAPKE